MIVQTLQTLVGEVNGLWSWIIGIIAGWGLTLSIVVGVLMYAHVRINALKRRIEHINNHMVSETRDLSIRLRTLEKH
jgi:uncharacterized membrane protein YciS (DUF1049 family)